MTFWSVNILNNLYDYNYADDLQGEQAESTHQRQR